jgi:hypothetical protein
MVLGLGAVGCGGSDDESDDTAAQAPATTAETAPGQPKSDGKKGGGNGGGGGGSAPGPALTGDPEEARAGLEATEDVYSGFGEAVEAGISNANVAVRDTLDSASGNESLVRVCDLMSEKAREQTITYARRSAGLADVEWNCENATGLLLRRASVTGGLKRSLRAEVIGVNVEGDRATASVRFGGKGAISSIPLVKEDGEWKLGSTPSGGS